jgi:hypothetical protein
MTTTFSATGRSGTRTSGRHLGLALLVIATAQQDVWGYSALRTGVSFLPVTVVMLAGSAAAAGGLYWVSRVTEHGTYAGGLLGPGLVIGAAFGLLVVPLTLVGLARVPETDSGAAASLLNAGRQVGGSIGLAVLGTVAWTVVSDHARAQAAKAAAAARSASPMSAVARHAAYQHALAAGFDRAFLVAAAIAAGIPLVAITVIRVRRADLAGS